MRDVRHTPSISTRLIHETAILQLVHSQHVAFILHPVIDASAFVPYGCFFQLCCNLQYLKQIALKKRTLQQHPKSDFQQLRTS